LFYWLKSPAAISAEIERGVSLGGWQKAWLLPAGYRGGDFSGN
jgi:hypothetical protein